MGWGFYKVQVGWGGAGGVICFYKAQVGWGAAQDWGPARSCRRSTKLLIKAMCMSMHRWILNQGIYGDGLFVLDLTCAPPMQHFTGYAGFDIGTPCGKGSFVMGLTYAPPRQECTGVLLCMRSISTSRIKKAGYCYTLE